MRGSLSIIALAAIAAAHPAITTAQSPKASEAAIRELLTRWEKAFRAKDLDGIMRVYAPGSAVVAYDVTPPLQIGGDANYRKSYEAFFAMYEGPLDLEVRDVRIIASGDVGFVHALERISGTMKGGQKSDLWIRATSGLRRIKGQWLIVHDHVSVP
jgi:uncharacterized protein (TIGR02246 family)